MTTSIREKILTAVKKAVLGTYAVEQRVYRSRQDAFRIEEQPCILIEPVADSADQVTIPRTTWTLSLRLVVFVNGEIPDKVADPIVVDMHKNLMSDLSLGGLCMDIQPVSVNFQFQESDNNAMAVICEYRIPYQTALQDISSLNC